jgi:uncharacterized membrane protein YgcG
MRIIFFLAVCATGCVANVESTVVAVDVRMTTACNDIDAHAVTAFRDELAPYGTWSDDDAFGTVWTPSDADFVPYATDGHFADLGSDIVWISDLPWGATTLHHGRWVRSHDRWSWVPGTQYAGAWVTWSRDGDKTSWTPTPPKIVWLHGAGVLVRDFAQPTVGSRSNDELALVPPAPTPSEITAEDKRRASAIAESERTYDAISRDMAKSNWFGDEGHFATERGGGGWHGGASSSHSSFSHGSTSSGHVSSSGGHGGRSSAHR